MKIKLIIICFALVGYDTLVQSASFIKTRDEETKEVVENYHARYPDLKKEDLYAEIENYGIGPQFIPFSSLIGQENLIVEKGEYIAKYNLILDTIATFNQLKVMMDIPEEVELWMENSDFDKPAHYNPVYRRVEIFPLLFTHTPSVRVFSFIHELTHVLQHQREGLLQFNKPTEEKAFEHEHQADSTAAQAICCPICFQIIMD